ncbi:MAG: hypothetical protein ACEPOV_09865 [Hyphomicrobiales bacterium]
MKKAILSLVGNLLTAGALWLLNILNLSYDNWYVNALSYMMLTIVTFNILRSVYKLGVAYRKQNN